jgi:hypothetical protein
MSGSDSYSPAVKELLEFVRAKQEYFTAKVRGETPVEPRSEINKFIDLCDTLDNTCLGNGMDDMVSVGKAQYMALINYANEMRGE